MKSKDTVSKDKTKKVGGGQEIRDRNVKMTNHIKETRGSFGVCNFNVIYIDSVEIFFFELFDFLFLLNYLSYLV